MAERIGGLRSADEPGDQRRLLQVQLGCRRVEVQLRRGLDAVGAAPEVDGVEVAVEDRALVELSLDLDREDRLLELSDQRSLRRQVRVLDQLLGDRRTALDALPPRVVQEGAGRAHRVDAAVLVEVAVLGGDDGVLEHVGDLVERDLDAVLALVELGDLVALRITDDRRLGLGRLGRELDRPVRQQHEEQQHDRRAQPGQQRPPEPLAKARLGEPGLGPGTDTGPARRGRHRHMVPVPWEPLGALPL
jgi:hypothetical protein